MRAVFGTFCWCYDLILLFVALGFGLWVSGAVVCLGVGLVVALCCYDFSCALGLLIVLIATISFVWGLLASCFGCLGLCSDCFVV